MSLTVASCDSNRPTVTRGSGDAVGAEASPGPPTRPNVLIVMTDDQRARGTLSVMPSVKRLFGSGGTTFVRAAATTPLCCPSRASFMTGRYAHNHGVRVNSEGNVLNLDHATTVQAYLQEAGYRTGIFGRFLNRWKLDRSPPHFDRYAIFHSGYYDAKFNVQGRVRIVRRYSTDFLADRAAEFVAEGERDDARPWLLFVTVWAPHSRAIPEPAYRSSSVPPYDLTPAMLEADRGDKPTYVRNDPSDPAWVKQHRAKELRTLMSVDDLVSRLFSALRSTDEAQETLAFFVSDNGRLWEEHGLRDKALPYPEAYRIPMLMRWPGRVKAAERDLRLAANIDVAPTILDAVGIDGETPMDGRSLLEEWDRDHLLVETFGSDKYPDMRWASLVTKRYRYTEYFRPGSGATNFREYYEWRGDPFELDNLLGDERKDNDPGTGALSARLARDLRCIGESCP